MQFQISSRMENRYRDTRVFKNRVFNKQFCFITCRGQHLLAVEKRRYSRFTFVENTISNSPKVLRAKSPGSNWFFCFSYKSKLGSFKNPFATISSLSKLYFRFRRFLLLVQTKKWFLWTITTAHPAKNHGHVRIFTIRDAYKNSNLNSITKFTSSSRSTEFKDIFTWNISRMITKTIPISTIIVISYAKKQDTLFSVCWKANGNWDSNLIRISQWGESHIKTNIKVRRKKINPEEQNCVDHSQRHE